MSHRRAKKIRQDALRRGELDEGVTRGAFLRATTDYEISRGQLVLKVGCPRWVIQKAKKVFR